MVLIVAVLLGLVYAQTPASPVNAAAPAVVVAPSSAAPVASSAPAVNLREVVTTRARAAIAEADAEIAASPANAERLNARKARLQALIDCLAVATSDVQACHAAYEASHTAWVEAHKAKAVSLKQQLAELSAKLDACSEQDNEEACSAPIKAQLTQVRAAVVAHRQQKEKNALHSKKNQGRCGRMAARKRGYKSFRKHFRAVGALLATDPVDADRVASSRVALTALVQARHDKVAAMVDVCNLKKDEAKRSRCNIRANKRLTELRRRLRHVERVFVCAAISDLAGRVACFKRTAKRVRATRPRASASCKRQACRKSFAKFLRVVKNASKAASVTDADQILATATAELTAAQTEQEQKAEKCRRRKSRQRRTGCLNRSSKRLATARTRGRVLRRLQACSSHVDPKRKKRCVRNVRHQARKINKCPHSRKSCKSQTKLRKQYRKALRSFKAAVGVLSSASATTDTVNTAVEGLAATVNAEQNGLLVRKEACKKLTKRRKRHACKRGVRRAGRALRRRRRAINRLRRCGRKAEASARRHCARRLYRGARKSTPTGCKHSKKSCTRRNKQRSRYVRFNKALRRLSKSIDTPQVFSVHADRIRNRLQGRVERLRARCALLTNARKQARCARRLRRSTKAAEKATKVVTKLQRCQDFPDTKNRRKCVRKLLTRVRKNTPKACHVNVCARQNGRRRKWAKLVKSLKNIAALVTAPTVSVHDVNKAATELTGRIRDSAQRSLAKLRRQCRKRGGKQSRVCRRRLQKARRAGRKGQGLVSRAQKCASIASGTVKSRTACVNRVLRRARESTPRRCRKNVCKRRNARRKADVRFLSAANRVAKIASGPTVTNVDVTAASADLSARLSAREQRIASRRERCRKIASSRRRSRCLRRVRAASKAAKRGRRIIKALNRCGARTDVHSRKRCVKRVMRAARRSSPRLCVTKGSNKRRNRVSARKHHRSLRRLARRQLRELSDLAVSMSAPDFSVPAFEKAVADIVTAAETALAKLKLRSARCRKISNRRRRRVCLRKVRARARVIGRQRRTAKGLARCRTVSDSEKRKRCIRRLLRRARRAVPKKIRSRRACARIARRRIAAMRTLRLAKRGDLKRLNRRLTKAGRRVTKREARCSRIRSQRRRSRCTKRARKARRRLVARTRSVQRLQQCLEHVDVKKKQRCQKSVVRRLSRSVPRPCPVSRGKCVRRQRARRDYERFLAGIRNIGLTIGAPTLNQGLVDAAVSDAVGRIRRVRAKLSRKLRRCGRSKSCRRRVRKQQKSLAKRRHHVRAASACARQPDEHQRRVCVRKVLRGAARKAPRGCVSNRKRRLSKLRHQYRGFLRKIARLSRAVSATAPPTPAQDLENMLQRAERSLNRRVMALRRKNLRCKKRRNHVRSRRCSARVRRQIRLLRRELRQIKALRLCSQLKEAADKAQCARRLVRRNRRRTPRPARSRRTCKKQKRARRRYAIFSKAMKALGEVISAAEIVAANVTAATTVLTTRFDLADAKIAKRLARCDNLRPKASARCRRSVVRAKRAIARRRKLLDRQSKCANEADQVKRADCVRQVRNVIARGFPRRCRRSTNCARKSLAIKRFNGLLNRVHSVATNLTNVDAALTSIEVERSTQVEKKRTQCVTATTRRKRRSCKRSVRAALKRIRVVKRAFDKLKACAALPDADGQTDCATRVVQRLAARRPRNCAVRRQISGHPRRRILRLRKRLVKCTSQKCRTRVDGLLRIQLQALAVRRANRLQRRAESVLARQQLYTKLAACGEDVVCQRSIRRQLRRYRLRSVRRRNRKLATLTQLPLLRKRMRTCRKDGEGETCRRAIVEDYRRAIKDLSLSLDVVLRKEAVRSFKRDLRSCVNNVDPVACRTGATQVFTDRITTLATDSAQMQYLTATRLCSLTDTAQACLDAAKVARDQDIAIQKDEAVAVAREVTKKVVGA